MRTNKRNKLISGVLSAVMAFGTVPSMFPALQTVTYAEQSGSSEYKNPSDTWINTGSRASEFDLNATKTVETNYCWYCQKDTLFDLFRVPEYTTRGTSALVSGMLYTDGSIGYNGDDDGFTEVIANIDDPTPSSGKFTNHHWTKSWCQKCGKFNTNLGVSKEMAENPTNPLPGGIHAAVDKNLYILYPCDFGFFHKFQTDDFQSFDEESHTSSRTVGDYCQFCKGTVAEPETVKEDHTYEHQVTAESGHNRFHKESTCSVCGYHMDSYMTAKSVVADYYGKADGQPHTVTVAEYSDKNVITSIKYGTDKNKITEATAPNFTDEGVYDVWYNIDYTAGIVNTSTIASYDEIGCAKVILYGESDNKGITTLPDGTIVVGSGDETIVIPPTHVHEFAYQSTVAPTEISLGYEIWQCSCGIVENRNFTPSLSKEPHNHEYIYKYTASPTNTELGYEVWECLCGVQEKRNYTPALVEDVHMHNYTYQYTVAATTTALGYEIWTCSCGNAEQRNYTATVSEDTHNFVYKWTEDPTCTADGYEVWQCANCGTVQRQNYKSKKAHDMECISTVPAGCSELGYEVWQCKNCGTQEKRNYVPSKGHNYEKSNIREATCNKTGLDIYICSNCKNSYTEETALNSNNHENLREVHDPAATCEKGGKVYNRCDACGYSVFTDVTDALGHSWNKLYTINPTCTEGGYTVEQCGTCKNIRTVNQTESTGHDWKKEGKVISDATCAADGLTEYSCKNCGDKKYEAVSATGHTPGVAATCTEPQTCTKCGAILELPKGHYYSETVTIPTCTSMGYTTFTCDDCGNSYVGNYTDKAEHHYHSVITPATCTTLGFTTYTCTECEDEYKSDYTEKKPHNYQSVVTPATCTAMGYTTYTCPDCGDSYVAEYTDVLPHNYTKKVITPTCTSQGYTIYTCPDCGKEYIGDEKESIEHNYTSVVTAPTCTEMGYSTYTCEDCGYSYIADYVDALGHDYEESVTAPTCTEIGFSTFSCSRCDASYVGNEQAKLPHNYNAAITASTCTTMGYTTFTCNDCDETYVGSYTDALGHDYVGVSTAPTCTELGYTTYTCSRCAESYKGDETAALGHTPSGWIVDVPATIEDEGHKYIKCEVCDITLKEETIEKLIDSGHTDEEGMQIVGKYDVTVSDKDGKPVFNSVITIDENDNITVELPDGRIITADDKTTVTVRDHDTKAAAEDINILVKDINGNNANGATNAAGQLTVPNDSSNAGSNDVVTDNVNTYVVVVTDKYGNVIPNCVIKVGENYAVDVYLPESTAMDDGNRITVTVVNEKSEPYEDLSIIVIGKDDNIERGKTNVNGQVTVPSANRALTDSNGIANVGEYIVKVENEPKSDRGATTPIKNALVTLTDEGKVLVKLPNGRVVMDFDNRTTVTVTKTSGEPVEGMDVNVYSSENEEGMTEKTNAKGQMTVPPWYMDIVPTDEPNTTATPKPDFEPTSKPDFDDPTPDVTTTPDATQIPDTTTVPTTKPEVTATPDATAIPTTKPEPTKRPIVTATPNVTTTPDVTATPDTTVKPTTKPNTTPTPKPANPSDYFVTVTDNNGTIGGAIVTVDKVTGDVKVELPDGKDLTPDNRIIVTVTNKNTGDPVIGTPVTVVDKDGDSASDLTNADGQAIVPSINSDLTDIKGDATVVEGEKVYHVNVRNEKDGNIANAVVHVENGEISVVLPDGKIIDYKNRTTVNVSDNDYAPIKGIDVTVGDSTGAARTEATNANGDAIVPPLNEDVQVTAEPDATNEPVHVVVPEPTADPNATATPTQDPNATDDPNATPAPTERPKYDNYDVVVTDKDGVIEGALVIADENGNLTVELPDGNTVDDYDNRVTVTVTSDGKPCEGVDVTVNDQNGGSRTESTDNDGKVVVPPLDEDKSDKDGKGDVSNDDKDYNITIKDETGAIPDADIKIDEDGNVTITLPDDKTLTPDNVITIVVKDKDDKPVADVPVTVVDKDGNEGKDKTGSTGIAMVPVSDEDYTDTNGYGIVGVVDEDGNVTIYNVVVENKKDGKIDNAHIVLKDGKILVTLPDDKTLTTSNQTTVTVTDKDGNPVKSINVTVSDNKTSKSANTNTYGKITVPTISTGGGGGGSSSGGGSSYSTGYNVTVTDKDGKTVGVTKSNVNTQDGKITLTLPNGYKLDDNYYTVTIKDTKGSTVKDVNVTLKTKDGKDSVSGDTDKNGVVVLPAVKHAAYVIGYEDGEFKPEGSMTRAEAAAIFARNIAERRGDTIRSNKTSFNDVKPEEWYAGYVSYLEKYDVIKGYEDGTFRPQDKITRAEFVTMCTRFYKLFDSVSNSNINGFTDVPSGHWAFKNVNSAVAMNWINGYSDGTFRPDNNITRAEVVTIVNRVTERKADTEYINKNTSKLDSFKDLKDKNYWAYTDILEAANEHTANEGSDRETWISVK